MEDFVCQYARDRVKPAKKTTQQSGRIGRRSHSVDLAAARSDVKAKEILPLQI
jgi:hypothetical protein